MLSLFRKFSVNHHNCDLGESYAFRVTQSAVQVRHLSGCDAAVVYFEVYILILLLSRVSSQNFLEVFCQNFPYSVEEASF